jgi:hypothetical protein
MIKFLGARFGGQAQELRKATLSSSDSLEGLGQIAMIRIKELSR